jgi:Tfp pilus assembly protein PilN
MSSPNELSFLPDDYMERKLQRRTNMVCALLFCIVMVAIASAFIFTERSLQRIQAEHDTVEKDYTAAAKRIQLVLDLQAKQKRMDQQATLAESLLEKVPRSHILAEVTNCLPVGVSLLDLIMESKLRAPPPVAKTAFEQKRNTADKNKKPAGPPAPVIKTFDVNLRITGLAATDVQVAQFISKLNQSELMKDVNLVITDEFKVGTEILRKFQIDARLDPKAEVAPDLNRTQTAAVEIKEK